MKKGYSIIEVIICMSLISIVITFSGINIKKFNKHVNEIEVEHCSFSIVYLINSAKLYCKQADKQGKIIFSIDDQNICFYCNQKLIDKIIIPSGFKLEDVKTSKGHNIIHIEKTGETGEECTIPFRDKFEELHSITVQVGSKYVEIKEN